MCCMQIEFRVARAFDPLPDSDLRTVFRDSDRIRKLDARDVQKIIRLFRTRDQNKKLGVRSALCSLPCPHKHCRRSRRHRLR